MPKFLMTGFFWIKNPDLLGGLVAAGLDRLCLGVEFDAVVGMDLIVILHPRKMVSLAIPVTDDLGCRRSCRLGSN